MVLKVHQDRTYCGAAVASLSVPWGETSQSRSGYHLVWSRDLVETAGAMVAMGAYDDARDVLRYLIATQQEDGHWLQNQWLGGAPFWQGIQLDEAAFPVILASALHEQDELDDIPVRDMVRRALRFIAREGPVTGQDRWEEDPGVNTFTLAIAIAALVEGSNFLDDEARRFALLLADNWNAQARRLDVCARTRRSPDDSGIGRLLHPHRAGRCAGARRRPVRAYPDQESRLRSGLACRRTDRHRFSAARALRAAPGRTIRTSSTA